MKKLLITLMIANGLLIGCSDKPMNFSCTNTTNSVVPESLSIKNGIATLNFMSYKAECHKNGNSTIYAASKDECAMTGDLDKRYSLLIFDNVVFNARAISRLGGGKSTEEIYVCKKVD